MSTTLVLRRAVNKVYERLSLYRLLYDAYKTYLGRTERQLLKKVLFQGAVVVDVGVNIGIYSNFLSRYVGPTGMIHSFEPLSDSFRRLSAATRELSMLIDIRPSGRKLIF